MDENKFKRDYEPAEYKTVPFVALKYEDEQGIVEHLITVFGIEDLGGDISHPGSFTKTLAERQPDIHVLDCHNSYSILDIVGVPLEIKEIGRDELPLSVLEEYPEATGAVWARTQFLLDTPEGSGVFKRLKSGAVKEFSYAYDALDIDWEEKDDGSRVRNLRTIRLWEYSPVLWGMNPATTVMGVKAEGGDDDGDVSDSNDGDGDATATEMKPVDESDTTITVRVRDSGDFESDSFRTIKIGKEDEGIQARIGHLKGETSTTIQAFLFSKPKWTVEKAQAWVKEHHKYVILIDIQVKEEQSSPIPEYAMLREVEVGIGMLKNIELRGRVGAGPTSSPTP